MGMTSLDKETWVNPRRQARAPTAFSWSDHLEKPDGSSDLFTHSTTKIKLVENNLTSILIKCLSDTVLLTCMSAEGGQPDWLSHETEHLSGLVPLGPNSAPSTPPEIPLCCLRVTHTNKAFKLWKNLFRQWQSYWMWLNMEWNLAFPITTLTTDKKGKTEEWKRQRWITLLK